MGKQTLGIGKKERSQMALLLKANMPVITPENTARVLNVTVVAATQLLALWEKKGWLSRVKHGIYIPVPLQSKNTNIMADEPWVLAKALFEPCYIGGWSAAEYWGLTEQIFNSTMIFSIKKKPSRGIQLKGVELTIKTIKKERMFGLKNVWKGDQKVSVSDATRTIVDAFNDPAVVGGIRMAIDILTSYLSSEHKNLDLLFEYGMNIKHTAFFKRIGFCLEQNNLCEKEYLEKLRAQIKPGYSQLDPAAPGKRLVTAWNLWVPDAWKKEVEFK
ncbi:MAG: hypothetical protein V4591_06855 [Bdellovibrionota bacterium]